MVPALPRQTARKYGQPYLTSRSRSKRVGGGRDRPSQKRVRRISIFWLAALAACALTASPAQAAKSGPDLKIAKLKLRGAPAPGQAFTVQVVVANAGRKKAGASQTALVLSKDAKVSKSDRRLARSRVKALKPRKRATATVKLTIAAGVAPGAYRVIACADAKRKVKETNERNNCKAALLTVVPPAMGGPVANPPGGPIAGGAGGPTATPPPPPPPPDGSSSARRTAAQKPLSVISTCGSSSTSASRSSRFAAASSRRL
jgi:hypothetical protein